LNVLARGSDLIGDVLLSVIGIDFRGRREITETGFRS
jgi:hypothetical protein